MAIEMNHRTEDEVCPVCKLDTYMNPSMRFLINTECYHKMCESCVDRIYSQGPAPCPYPNCGKTLRKNRFKRQVFSDVNVEREVDVRKRVASIFNRRREEFASLKEYNDYLEEVETAIFNLVNKIDVEATEARLQSYENENKQAIQANAMLRNQEAEIAAMNKKMEEERRMQQRAAAIEELRTEQEVKRAMEKKIIRDLASASEGEAENIVRKAVFSKESALKKSSARRGARESVTVSFADTALSMLSGAQRLAHQTDLQDDTPFNGLEEEIYDNKYYTAKEHYFDPFLDNIEKSQQARASGYMVDNVYDRLLFSAFMGIGCFVDKEKSNPGNSSIVTAVPL
ncbi:CDK-activating kinase assembly factor MAT1-domain-containing protein [Dipodascopsis uninucleata]